MIKKYEEYLKKKVNVAMPSGFDIPLKKLNHMLFDWQAVITKWALARGRAALFEDCGLGKTCQLLEWSKQIHKKEKEPILILAPLAVSEQTQREGVKFEIDVNICVDDSDVINGINITNYEKLHKFDPDRFVGIVLDESSILKNFSGAIRNEIIGSFQKTKYRLACTATPAPNDYMELGNHSEFLGVMTRSEMLSTFFINDTDKVGHWRLKGHVKNNIFWKWMASWAIMINKPSDIGFDNGGFELPEIEYHEHIIKSDAKPTEGLLLLQTASTLDERRKVRRETVEIRCQTAADIINPTDSRWVCWVNLNPEGEAITKKVNYAKEVAGRHSNDIKIQRMIGFASGDLKRIATKPKIAGLGMNWQVCNKAAFIGLSDSWEQFYQAVRRIWRFGQKEKVDIHIFIEEREGSVLKNIRRKDKQAKLMTENMINHTKDFAKIELEQSKKTFIDYSPTKKMY